MDEVNLKKDLKFEFDPSLYGSIIVLQNPMSTTDDIMYISSHGNIDKAWVEIEPKEKIEISSKVYLLQKSWNQITVPFYIK